jgi:hypothetical protein
MNDDMKNTAEKLEVVEPTEVIPAPRKLIDGGNVIILVGDERGQTPVPLPAVFQQLFAVLGDLDRRLTALEEKAKSAIVRLN